MRPVGASGGYGICIGPRASKAELQACRAALLADPANYIAQPMVALSVTPMLTENGIEPRHVDLRPFAVTGRSTWVLPGGLSRVALEKGSVIVNSSQGGGSKDTWVLAEPHPRPRFSRVGSSACSCSLVTSSGSRTSLGSWRYRRPSRATAGAGTIGAWCWPSTPIRPVFSSDTPSARPRASCGSKSPIVRTRPRSSTLSMRRARMPGPCGP